MTRYALAVALLFAATPALAAAPAWSVDKAASSVRFSSSFNGDAFSGAFRRWDAAIRFDPKQLAASSVTATLDVASASTGDKDRDQALPSDDFFAVAKFPRATFAATSFKDLGGGRYQAIGTLTLRGVAKPLTLPFTLAITGANARMKASLAINRLAFGVGQNEWKSVQAIPAAVNVNIDLTAHRTP
ncbi:MAG TPA: YceI family protein [Caulobacteraceae bacterium]|jgi:polyisoprenoid-binding protein YceI|nr:YceI family protein [Caulobacteraceae bacterium]